MLISQKNIWQNLIPIYDKNSPQTRDGDGREETQIGMEEEKRLHLQMTWSHMEKMWSNIQNELLKLIF